MCHAQIMSTDSYSIGVLNGNYWMVARQAKVVPSFFGRSSSFNLNPQLDYGLLTANENLLEA